MIFKIRPFFSQKFLLQTDLENSAMGPRGPFVVKICQHFEKTNKKHLITHNIKHNQFQKIRPPPRGRGGDFCCQNLDFSWYHTTHCNSAKKMLAKHQKLVICILLKLCYKILPFFGKCPPTENFIKNPLL